MLWEQEVPDSNPSAPIRRSDDILDTVLRFGAAIVVGGAIGLNRDLRGKPAGVRTHALVALGAALATSILKGDGKHPDAVSRVVEGIITGIGFLGAGVILRGEGGRAVRALTTAASIWSRRHSGSRAALVCGSRLAAGTALALSVLLLGGPLENAVHRLRRQDGERRAPGRDGSPGSGTSGTGSLPLDSAGRGQPRSGPHECLG